MNDRYAETADVLLKIEAEMRRLALWENLPPACEALQSPLPFCHDTLKFSQWIQFVLLARMKRLIETGGPLPTNSDIYPMAEECFKQVDADTHHLAKLLLNFDELLGKD